MLKPSLLSVAPMMDWTDRHCRYLMRLISPDIQLYSEMTTAQAILHGDVDYLLGYDQTEHPLTLQLGGSDPAQLAICARIGEDYGYDEINLNVGCPSPRVKAGRFGACLMLEPQWVAECIHAMQAAVNIPVTIKCRIGVDDADTYEKLHYFVHLNAAAGCQTFIVHARKAWLTGLSPKENRTIPPLQYDIVYQLKRDFPHLSIILNGGVQSIADVEAVLPQVDGVMIGRAAYHNLYLLAALQKKYYPAKYIRTREEIMDEFERYMQTQLKKGIKRSAMTRHVLGLYYGVASARAWRRVIHA